MGLGPLVVAQSLGRFRPLPYPYPYPYPYL